MMVQQWREKLQMVGIKMTMVDGSINNITEPLVDDVVMPFPWIIRDPITEGEITPTLATQYMGAIQPSGVLASWNIKQNYAATEVGQSHYHSIKSIEVITTHSANTRESAACQALNADSPLADYLSQCQTQSTPVFMFY